MCAVVCHGYGDPKNVVELVNSQDVPGPDSNDVLVKVECSSVSAADRPIIRTHYPIIYMMLGWFKPAKKYKIPEMDIAGTVQAVGDGVDGFEIGDEVAADMRKALGGGMQSRRLQERWI